MGLSLRAYARHRGVTLAAVQKARQSGRIPVLVDGTVEAGAADEAWDAATVRRAAQRASAVPTRVVRSGESVALAEQTAKAVLAEHGAPACDALTIADVRLASELLRVQQRANAIAAHEAEYRLRLRRVANEVVDKCIVDALVANTIHVIWRFVPPGDVPAALDTLRELQAHCLDRPTPAE
jgi:hypothetical protein